MPPVVAAVATAIAYIGVGATTAAIAAEILVGAILSVGLSMASKALAGKPKGMDKGQTVSFRAAAEPVRIIYGETRVGGPFTFMGTTGYGSQLDNRYLWVFVGLAGHPVEEIGTVYFNDEAMTFDTEASGITSAAGGARFTNLIGGAQGTSGESPGGGLRGHAWLLKRLGTFDQTPNANARAIPWISDVILPSDRFSCIAYVGATFAHNNDKFPSGPPNLSAIVKGRKVYDPRQPSHDIDDPDTWTFSKNAALCVADYLRGVPMYTAAGVVSRLYGLQASDEEIDWDYVIEAANVCDESVQLFGGGTQLRYTCNGSIDSDVAPGDGLQSLLTAMSGHIAFSGGKWKIFAGAYRTPVASFNDDDQCGPSKTQAKRARRDLFNGIKGKYRGPSTFYQNADFPAVQVSEFVETDNNEEIWQEIELPFTDTAAACQRIAMIDLRRNRQQIVTERTFKLSALYTSVGDTIQLTDARKGWTDKIFEITRWELVTQQDNEGQPYLAVRMMLAEHSSSVFDWDPDNDEVAIDDEPDTNLPRPWVVALPGAPSFVEELYQTRQGSGVKTRITLSWAAAQEGYLLDYIPEYKLSSEATWTVLPSVLGTTIIINDIGAGVYDFRVKARNRLGVTSEYSTTTGLTVYGLGAPPSALTSLGIQPLGNMAMLTWVQSADLDVREGGYIEFRHSTATSGATWTTATDIREAVSGQQTYASVPLKAGTYILRPVDSSGIPGPETSVTTKQASINGFTSAAGSPISEATTFSGTQSNTVASGGILKLANAGIWDDIADLDALGDNIDDSGGLAAEGVYTFNNAYDFGAVTKVRLTSVIAAEVTNILANIDDIEANIDDWASFDQQLDGGQADAWVEFRQTDDNPGGSPTWTSWMRLDTAEVEARGVQARVQMRSYDLAYNIEIATLQVKAETRT